VAAKSGIGQSVLVMGGSHPNGNAEQSEAGTPPFDAVTAAGDTSGRVAQAPGRGLREGKRVNRASIRSHLLLLVLAVSVPLVVNTFKDGAFETLFVAQVD